MEQHVAEHVPQQHVEHAEVNVAEHCADHTSQCLLKCRPRRLWLLVLRT